MTPMLLCAVTPPRRLHKKRIAQDWTRTVRRPRAGTEARGLRGPLHVGQRGSTRETPPGTVAAWRLYCWSPREGRRRRALSGCSWCCAREHRTAPARSDVAQTSTPRVGGLILGRPSAVTESAARCAESTGLVWMPAGWSFLALRAPPCPPGVATCSLSGAQSSAGRPSSG